MPFSQATIKAAWTRSGGVCECTLEGHGHQRRCTTRLLWTLQGGEVGAGWRACRKAGWGTDVLASSEIRRAKCAGRHAI